MTERLLLADDSEIVLHMLGGQLGADGFEVVTCASGTAAIELATQQGPFDLLILDVVMPDLSGFEVTRRLRREASCAKTPVLLLTTLDSTEDKVAGLEAGADDFLTKTVSDEELLARVHSLVDMGRARQRQTAARATAASILSKEGGAPAEAPRVFVVHQDEDQRALLLAVCREDLQLGDRVGEAAELAHLARTAPGVVLVSFERMVANGLSLAERFSEWESQPAVLVIDDHPTAERRITAYQLGAEDYVSASTQREEISARVNSALRRRQRYREVENARDRALEVALTDALTGLYNRAYLEEVLRNECRRVARYAQPAAVVLIDVDHFKKVNDTWGHGAGDQVLRELARRITRGLRASDVAARLGGEEFVVLLPSTSGPMAVLVAERLRAAIEAHPFETTQGALPVTASLGVAVTIDGADPTRLIEEADTALYAAKRSGRNRVKLSGQSSDSAPPERCPFCEALENLETLNAEDLDTPLTALRAAAHLAPRGNDAHTDVIMAGVRESADAVVERLAQLDATLRRAARDHICSERKG